MAVHLSLTPHAVDRFVDRCAPGMGHREARELLESGLASAAPLRTKTPLGHQRWRLEVGDIACVLVSRPAREDGRQIVVTILPDAPDGPAQEDAACAELLIDARERLRDAQALTKHSTAADRARRIDELKVLRAQISVWKELQQTARLEMQLRAAEQRQQEERRRREQASDDAFQARIHERASQQRKATEMREALRVLVRGIMTGRIVEAKQIVKDGPMSYIFRPSFWDSADHSDGDK